MTSYGSNLSIAAKVLKAVTNVPNGYNTLLTDKFCISCVSPWKSAFNNGYDGTSNTAGIAIRQYLDCTSGDWTLYSPIASPAPAITYWTPNPITYVAGATTIFGTTQSFVIINNDPA